MPENYEQYGLVVFCDSPDLKKYAAEFADKTGYPLAQDLSEAENADLMLRYGTDGVSLECAGRSVRCDFTAMLPRLKKENLSRELLVRAAKIKNLPHTPTVVDATAGMGEDSLLLAAAGFNVKMFERNPVIAQLLKDGISRALLIPELKDTVSRMELFEKDSIEGLAELDETPDVVFLDPMFPQKEKSALSRKKFQLLHHVELPCFDGELLLSAAIASHPRRIVIKRPLKGPYLCNKKPSFSLIGKAIRYDCILLP